jgi:hypothetical protein
MADQQLIQERCNPQVCSAHFLGLGQKTMCFRLPFTLPSSYMGELPNSHGRTLTDESYVMHGILSGTETARGINAFMLTFYVFHIRIPIETHGGIRT